MDPNFAPRHDIPNWIETRYFGHYSPEAGVGLLVHVGRQRGYLDLWWSHIAVLLPDGQIVVDRQWLRTSDPMGLRGGNLTFVSTHPRHSLYCAFDGGGQLCSEEALVRRTRGDGAGLVPVRWELQATALRPVWDMMAQHADATWAGGHQATHRQQHFRCSGSLTVGRDSYALDGPGYNDHSSGLRSFESFGGHWYFTAIFPALSIFQVTDFDETAQPRNCVGAVIQGDDVRYVTHADAERAADALGGPRKTSAVLTLSDDTKVAFDAEVIAMWPITINHANENLNGFDWEHPQGTVLWNECWTRYTLPDGTIGYGHLERSFRREWVDRDSLLITYPTPGDQ